MGSKQYTKDRKRPYSHLVVEPSEKVRMIRSLKVMLEEEKKVEKQELFSLKSNLAHMQTLIEDKLSEVPRSEDINVSTVLKNSALLERIMDFVNVRDLANCRLVNRQWNVVASSKVKTRKILKLVTFQYKQSSSELTATGLVRNIHRRHNLFPFQKFEITMGYYATLMVQFCEVYAPLIKYLHLRFDSSRNGCGYGLTSSNLQDFTTALALNFLQNCTYLEISDFPVTSDTLQTFSPAVSAHNQVKVLKYAIDYKGTRANYINENSYHGKLLKSCLLLDTLTLFIKYNCNVESGDIMQNVIEAINQAELKHLKDLRLEWEDSRNRTGNQKAAVANVDFPQLLPCHFKLKSFKLVNTSCATLLPFLKYHSESLETLKIHFSKKSETIDIKINSLLQLELPHLKRLSLPGCLSQEEMDQMLKLIMVDHFPNVSRLKISEFGSKLRKATPDFNTSVTQLKLELDNDNSFAHSYQSVLSFIEAFPFISGLGLKHASQHVLRNIWRTTLRANLTEFSMSNPAKQGLYNETYELDSILTGYSPQYCKKILLNYVNSEVFFDLFSFDVTGWTQQWMVQRPKITDPDHISIARFENLRKLKISYPGGHITEVGLIYILRELNRLTSLTIEHSSIRKYFLPSIRDSLGPAFHLDVDCFDSS